MKTLNLYVGKQLLVSFLVTLLVLTFIMLSASLIQASQLMAKGMELSVFMRFVALSMPKALGMTIPFALLASTILVFSRLSADYEITAMRAGGVSIWQIITPGLLLSLVLSCICIFLQLYLIPNSSHELRQIKKRGDVANPKYLMEPGRFISFEGYLIFISDMEEIDENNQKLEDVHIITMNDKEQVTQDVTARYGQLVHHRDDKTFELRLFDASVVNIDPDTKRQNPIPASKMSITLNYADQLNSLRLTQKRQALTLSKIFARIKWFREMDIDTEKESHTMGLYVELHKRLVLALSPFAFLLLGIPFGIRTSRTETSLGMVISLALAMLFYVFVILAENLKYIPKYHPDFLIWIPCVVYQIGGLWAMKRISKR